MSLKSDIRRLTAMPKLAKTNRIPTPSEGIHGEMRVFENVSGHQLFLKYSNKWFKLRMDPVTKSDTSEVQMKVVNGALPDSSNGWLQLSKYDIPKGSVVGINFGALAKDSVSDPDEWHVHSFRTSSSTSNSLEVYYNEARHRLDLEYIGSNVRGKKWRALIFYKG
jgi:hypothetical protein